MIKFAEIIEKVILWRLRSLKHKQLIYILSVFIGILGGFAAIILKNLVTYTGMILTEGFNIKEGNLLYLTYPLIGIILTVIFVQYFVKDKISHGISRILFCISKKNSLLKPHHTYSSIIAGTLTTGFGGSVGTEAPIVLTGAAIGSNLGRIFHFSYKYRTLLVGCGSAAAIAGIFKAPLASVVFALEVLMLDLSMWSIIPLLISAVTATTISQFLLGKEVLFSFTVTFPFQMKNIPYYLILGVFTGFISLYFTRGSTLIEALYEKISNNFVKVGLGGILLGILIFLFPPLFGEGYHYLKILHSDNPSDIMNTSLFYQLKDYNLYFLLFLFSVIVFKIFAMSITLASGGVGGIFAPSLFMGGVSGFFLARLLNSFSPWFVSEANFSLVGMAGVMSGVMHAPLTAIFLIAEITGGYSLLLPIMLTSTISYITIFYFEPHSIYTKKLAKRGELITHHKDKAILNLMKVTSAIEKDFSFVDKDADLGDIVSTIALSKRNIFPVVDKENFLLGLIYLDDVRNIIFKPELYHSITVKELMKKPVEVVSLFDTMEEAIIKFEKSNAWNLPVVAEQVYIGFISKSNIFDIYRNKIVEFSDE